MTPNADFETKEGRAETFYLSNVVPQAKKNNRKIWAALEALVREWVMLRGEAYIVTGGMFYDPDEESGSSANGSIEYEVIGQHEVAVPTHLFKIVLAPSAPSSSTMEAISFVFENREYQKVGDAYPFAEGLVSIDWIEERAGINFFPDLGADPASEHQIEGTVQTALWPTE